jgi:glycosyltransferase involved in cell wall biosynthesis
MKQQKKQQKPLLPFVSVCTPTFNRRPFIPIMFECFKNQNYPKDRIEWIIVDDGTDCIQDLIETAKIPQIKYFYKNKKMLLGEKRNYIHSHCQGDILVYMDDDDYYPPERISHAVDMLIKTQNVLCAGSSEIYVYFKFEKEQNKMMQFGPYNQNHATAGTFAFKKELLNVTKYNDEKALAEEREFLKDYTIPFVQLDPLKTILVFSHNHNSFDKKKLLIQSNPIYMKESNKTVNDFIRNSNEKQIRDFFTKDIDEILKKYSFGEAKNKPDVLQQMQAMENLQKQQQQQQQQQCVYLEHPGQPRVALTPAQIVDIIQKQNELIQQQNQVIQQLQQQKIVVHKHKDEPPVALTHAEIIEYIVKQQKMIAFYQKT